MQEIPRSQNQIRRRPIKQAQREPVSIPEPASKGLTRDQYLALLKMARNMRKVLAYLAMRAFVSTGIQQQELLALTVEEVQTGKIQTADRVIHLPDSLREELLAYARRNGVSSGAIFVSKTGAPTSLITVRDQIREVSRAAGIDDGATCARALQNLYKTTRAGLMAETAQRLMQEQLDREQREHGWEA